MLISNHLNTNTLSTHNFSRHKRPQTAMQKGIFHIMKDALLHSVDENIADICSQQDKINGKSHTGPYHESQDNPY